MNSTILLLAVRRLLLVTVVIGGLCASAWAAPTLDSTPRVAVMSAFGAELNLLMSQVSEPQKQTVNGVTFTTGTLKGKPVVLLLSGVSMTNAAMTTQLVLDRFNVTHIVFSGIAGGVNPALQIGDVTVAEQWSQYLEVLMAREIEPGKYAPPSWMDDVKLPNFGMAYPRPVGVRTARGFESRYWFPVDPKLLEIAKRAGQTPLSQCDTSQHCLGHQPRVVVGGNGVSGQAFVDNAAFREYAFKTFKANVLDMETAAVAHVAYSNSVPFIAFRSLSDLAGGGSSPNEIDIFMNTAADNSAKVLLAFFAEWAVQAQVN